MNFVRWLRAAGFVFLTLAILLIGAWGSLAIWYQCTTDGAQHIFLAAGLAGVFTSFTLLMVALFLMRRRWLFVGVFFVAVAILLVWWATISPTKDRDWSPDVARTVTATIDGDQLVVINVRNFNWRSEDDFEEIWQRRTYQLSHVTDVDLVMSYWAGEAIAHTIVSFGFADGERLAFSIETRKERNEPYSAIAGFFKRYELAIIAADERDVVRLRSNIRGEDVRIYRLRMTPANAQRLLREYLAEVNELAAKPHFYNTLTSNCTTLVFDMVRVIHPGLPLDPRVIFSGYLPNYAYDVGATDRSVPFDELRALSRIHDKAVEAGADPNFSAKIREGIPVPH